MHDRLQSAILLNNVIKTILPRSIGLFGFFLTNSGHCSDIRSFFNLISLRLFILMVILFADLRFASIDYGKTKESGGKVRL
jgi:hypothetical protein